MNIPRPVAILIASAILVCATPSQSDARAMMALSYQEMLEKSDLVVVATAKSKTAATLQLVAKLTLVSRQSIDFNWNKRRYAEVPEPRHLAQFRHRHFKLKLPLGIRIVHAAHHDWFTQLGDRAGVNLQLPQQWPV